MVAIGEPIETPFFLVDISYFETSNNSVIGQLPLMLLFVVLRVHCRSLGALIL